MAETCHAENATQLITHVEVTPSSGSDTDVTVPLVDGLAERKVRPDELFAHMAYRSSRNAFEAYATPGDGTGEPWMAGLGAGELPRSERGTDRRRSLGRTSRSTSPGSRPTVCPAGHRSVEEYELEDAPERVEVHFARATCEPCPLRSRCPVQPGPAFSAGYTGLIGGPG